MKVNAIIISAVTAAAALCGCSAEGEQKTPEITVISAESTDLSVTEQTSSEEVSVIPDTDETSDGEISAETGTHWDDIPEEPADDLSEYEDTASVLFGALDYIDRIGGGNIPKEEETVEIDGREFAKVVAQFSDTSDLREFMEDNLTQSLIDSRYSQILGTDEPYYIDIDGVLYGYVTAKGCGFAWVTENDSPVITIGEVSDDSFSASILIDDYGAQSELTAEIVMDDGMWKINSFSY